LRIRLKPSVAHWSLYFTGKAELQGDHIPQVVDDLRATEKKKILDLAIAEVDCCQTWSE
jgi:hypothetical protein